MVNLNFDISEQNARYIADCLADLDTTLDKVGGEPSIISAYIHNEIIKQTAKQVSPNG